jgi:predicted dehydrogenase
MKLTVIGCGRWGKNILRTLAELEETLDFTLNEVVHTGNPDRKKWVRGTIGVECHSDLETAMDRNDAVCIATPDETHSELVEKSLRQGLDVFVEKPLAFDVGKAQELLERADSQDTVLMPGHLMVFHPVLEALENEASFSIDDVDEILVTRQSDLRESGERRLIHSSLVHDIALLDYFFGQPPDTIVVDHAQGPFPPLRSLSAQLSYGDTIINVDARSDWPFPERSIIFRDNETFFQFNGIEESLTITSTSDDSNESDRRDFEDLPLTTELAHFVRAILGKTPCRISPDHVTRVMKTMDEMEGKALKKLN